MRSDLVLFVEKRYLKSGLSQIIKQIVDRFGGLYEYS